MSKIINSLYWRISAAFLLLLIVVGIAYISITVQTAEQYFQDKQQRLNAPIAKQIVHEVAPFLNGEVNKEAMDVLMHHLMAINPAIEVYVLDPAGKILAYVAPYKKVKLEEVETTPILTFMETEGKVCVKGDDPRNPGIKKVFSAAPVEENGKLVGYVYVVLASEEYDSVTEYLEGNYLMNLGARNMAFTLIASLLIGLLVIWIVTKNLRTIIETVKRFEQGDLHARIPLRSNTELTQLARTFNEMADTILEDINKREAVENLRKELIANVSHDLRTPLSVIHGYIETLFIKGENLEKEDREQYLQTALRSTEKLEQLVNELFELSKLEAEQVQLQKEPFPISELIQDVTHKYQILAQDKGITLKPIICKDLTVVNADIALIERVLQNLIDNALKFTSEGGTITVEIKKLDNEVEVSVSDTGTGISEEEIPFIFDRFRQARHNHTQKGSGLGLAIVKKILELHNSTIQLTSQLNKGTAFSFQLPAYLQ